MDEIVFRHFPKQIEIIQIMPSYQPHRWEDRSQDNRYYANKDSEAKFILTSGNNHENYKLFILEDSSSSLPAV